MEIRNSTIPIPTQQKLIDELEGSRWIPVDEKSPENDTYVLVSFENFTMPDIARYEEDKDGGTFYPGDEERSYKSYGLIVKAWRPMPEPYRSVSRTEDMEVEMIEEILSGRKTCARQIIEIPEGMSGRSVGRFGDRSNPLGFMYPGGIKRPPYQPGYILYVHERHIWLKVTDTRIERLQDITEAGVVKEGLIDDIEYAKGMSARDHFARFWDATIKKTEMDRYGWEADPWVWVIEFERCEMSEEGVKMDAIDRIVKQLEEEKEYAFADFYSYVDATNPWLDAEYDDLFHRGLERAIEIINENRRNQP